MCVLHKGGKEPSNERFSLDSCMFQKRSNSLFDSPHCRPVVRFRLFFCYQRKNVSHLCSSNNVFHGNSPMHLHFDLFFAKTQHENVCHRNENILLHSSPLLVFFSLFFGSSSMPFFSLVLFFFTFLSAASVFQRNTFFFFAHTQRVKCARDMHKMCLLF